MLPARGPSSWRSPMPTPRTRAARLFLATALFLGGATLLSLLSGPSRADETAAPTPDTPPAPPVAQPVEPPQTDTTATIPELDQLAAAVFASSEQPPQTEEPVKKPHRRKRPRVDTGESFGGY